MSSAVQIAVGSRLTGFLATKDAHELCTPLDALVGTSQLSQSPLLIGAQEEARVAVPTPQTPSQHPYVKHVIA